MSWDVFVFRLPSDVAHVSEIPKNWDYKLRLSRDVLVEALVAVAPDVNLERPGWPRFERDDSFIELQIPTTDVIDDFVFRVAGGGGGIGAIVELLNRLGLRAIDTGSGDILDMNNPLAGFNRWAGFRDRAVAASPPSRDIAEP